MHAQSFSCGVRLPCDSLEAYIELPCDYADPKWLTNFYQQLAIFDHWPYSTIFVEFDHNFHPFLLGFTGVPPEARSSGVPPHVTVKDVSSSGSAAKAASHVLWCFLGFCRRGYYDMSWWKHSVMLKHLKIKQMKCRTFIVHDSHELWWDCGLRNPAPPKDSTLSTGDFATSPSARWKAAPGRDWPRPGSEILRDPLENLPMIIRCRGSWKTQEYPKIMTIDRDLTWDNWHSSISDSKSAK